MNLILDGVIVLIFLLALFVGYKKGALASILSLVGGIAALVCAFLLAAPLGNFLCDRVVEPALKAPVAEKIASVFQVEIDADTSLLSFLNQKPEEVEHLLSTFQTDDAAVADAAKDGTQALAGAIVAPIAKTVSCAIAFFVLLILFLLLVRLLIHFARGLNRVPILGTANRVIGLVIGLIKGLIFAWAFCAVFALALPYLQSLENPFLSAVREENTLLFRALHSFNPLTVLTSTIFPLIQIR